MRPGGPVEDAEVEERAVEELPDDAEGRNGGAFAGGLRLGRERRVEVELLEVVREVAVRAVEDGRARASTGPVARTFSCTGRSEKRAGVAAVEADRRARRCPVRSGGARPRNSRWIGTRNATGAARSRGRSREPGRISAASAGETISSASTERIHRCGRASAAAFFCGPKPSNARTMTRAPAARATSSVRSVDAASTTTTTSSAKATDGERGGKTVLLVARDDRDGEARAGGPGIGAEVWTAAGAVRILRAVTPRARARRPRSLGTSPLRAGAPRRRASPPRPPRAPRPLRRGRRDVGPRRAEPRGRRARAGRWRLSDDAARGARGDADPLPVVLSVMVRVFGAEEWAIRLPSAFAGLVGASSSSGSSGAAGASPPGTSPGPSRRSSRRSSRRRGWRPSSRRSSPSASAGSSSACAPSRRTSRWKGALAGVFFGLGFLAKGYAVGLYLAPLLLALAVRPRLFGLGRTTRSLALLLGGFVLVGGSQLLVGPPPASRFAFQLATLFGASEAAARVATQPTAFGADLKSLVSTLFFFLPLAGLGLAFLSRPVGEAEIESGATGGVRASRPPRPLGSVPRRAPRDRRRRGPDPALLDPGPPGRRGPRRPRRDGLAAPSRRAARAGARRRSGGGGSRWGVALRPRRRRGGASGIDVTASWRAGVGALAGSGGA